MNKTRGVHQVELSTVELAVICNALDIWDDRATNGKKNRFYSKKEQIELFATGNVALRSDVNSRAQCIHHLFCLLNNKLDASEMILPTSAYHETKESDS